MKRVEKDGVALPERVEKRLSLLYFLPKREEELLFSQKERFTFFKVERGCDILSSFRKNRPDIVVSFANEEAMKDICRLKKESDPPIVLVGEKDADTLYEALQCGIDAYLLLPLQKEELSSTLDRLSSQIFMQKAKAYQTFMLHQYKHAIDSSNIVSKTDINGIITYVNEEFCKISGYSKEELIGKNHNIVRHPDVPKENFEKFWKTILAKRIWKGTVKNRAKDGSTFFVNTTVTPILDKDGNIAEFVAIRYDVTKSVKLQEKLQKKERELELLNKELEERVEIQTKKLKELNLNLEKRIKEEVDKNRQKDRLMFQQARLAALGEMLGNIAHQWRQPLMELGILLYKIKKRAKGDRQISESYAKSSEILERMSQTIVDFQNFFSPNKTREVFDIARTIEQSISIIEGSLKKSGIKVLLRSETPMKIKGYKNEFSQVIINLISNAKDALNERNPSQKHIAIDVKREGNYACISVTDNAGGIKEDVMERIFEPYFTTKQSSHGTGLGLYMSKMIIEQSMGGSLTAQNDTQGAKFIIKIPYKSGEDDGV